MKSGKRLVLVGCASVVLSMVLPLGAAWAQDLTQTIGVAPPPTRRIGPPPADATPAELEEGGDQLRGEKAYLDAIDYYEAALNKLPKKDPEAAVVLNKVGIAQLQMTRYDEAKKSFEKSIKIDKTYAKSYNNLGVIHYHNRKYGRAVKYYKKAIELEPDTPSFHSNIGSAYFAMQKLDMAIPEYQRALQLDPDIFERRSTIGIVAQMSSPEDRAHYSYVMAKMYAQMGMLDRSLLYLRRAMEEGYKDINNALQDAEFAQLRKDPRFNDLMTQRPPSIP
jgi:tetratricopeptide (TPR) repeat protein